MIQRMKAERNKNAFEMYVTEILRAITQNTARVRGGTTIEVKYTDLINDGPKKPQRTSQDIINSVSKTLEFMRKEEE